MSGGLGAIREVFRIRNYRYYLCGHFVSALGNWVQRIALSWLTWELTGSATWLGIIAFCEMFPTFVIGLIAGAVIDRSDSLRVLKITQLFSILQAVGLAVMALNSFATIELIAALALSRGVITSFNRPARMTTVFYIAGREHLSSAIAVNAMIFSASRFLGPAIGGLIIAATSVGWAFVFNAATFIFFYAALAALRIDSVPIERSVSKNVVAEAVDGLRYSFGQEGVRFLLVVICVEALFLRPFIDLLPAFAADVFGRGAQGYSALLSVHGVGAVLGGYWIAQRGGTAGYIRVVVVTLLALALALLAFSLSRNYWVALPVMLVTGASFVILGITVQTMLQASCAAGMRGRVVSLYGVIARGMPALGALMMGASADIFGLPTPVATGALLCLALWFWTRSQRQKMSQLLE